MAESLNPGVNTVVEVDAQNQSDDKKWTTARSLIRRAEHEHSRLPGIRKIPLRSIGVILLVALVNVIVWIAVAVVLVCCFYVYNRGIGM